MFLLHDKPRGFKPWSRPQGYVKIMLLGGPDPGTEQTWIHDRVRVADLLRYAPALSSYYDRAGQIISFPAGSVEPTAAEEVIGMILNCAERSAPFGMSLWGRDGGIKHTINIHRVLFLFGMEKIASELECRLWWLFQYVKLSVTDIFWIWSTFGSQSETVGPRSYTRELWSAADRVQEEQACPFASFHEFNDLAVMAVSTCSTAFRSTILPTTTDVFDNEGLGVHQVYRCSGKYVQMMAWQLINLHNIGAIDHDVDEYIKTQPKLAFVVNQRYEEMGTDADPEYYKKETEEIEEVMRNITAMDGALVEYADTPNKPVEPAFDTTPVIPAKRPAESVAERKMKESEKKDTGIGDFFLGSKGSFIDQALVDNRGASQVPEVETGSDIEDYTINKRIRLNARAHTTSIPGVGHYGHSNPSSTGLSESCEGSRIQAPMFSGFGGRFTQNMQKVPGPFGIPLSGTLSSPNILATAPAPATNLGFSLGQSYKANEPASSNSSPISQPQNIYGPVKLDSICAQQDGEFSSIGGTSESFLVAPAPGYDIQNVGISTTLGNTDSTSRDFGPTVTLTAGDTFDTLVQSDVPGRSRGDRLNDLPNNFSSGSGFNLHGPTAIMNPSGSDLDGQSSTSANSSHGIANIDSSVSTNSFQPGEINPSMFNFQSSGGSCGPSFGPSPPGTTPAARRMAQPRGRTRRR